MTRLTPPMRVLMLLLTSAVGRALAQAPTNANPHGTLRDECATCHRPEGWKPARISSTFQHAPRTFPLEGAHARTACASCHKRLDFKETSAKCASCHSDVHKGELGADCSRCHTPRSFVDRAAMRHAHELTRFPLRGAHAAATCEACHTPSSPGQLQFVNRPITCVGCHAPDFRAARSPDHQAAGFPSTCGTCHTTVMWSGAKFDHAMTRFLLTGAHLATACTGCHADGVYRGKSTDCVSCHQTNFNSTTNPPHTASGFPTTCATCHATTAWRGAVFSHSATTFPLTGAHLAVACNQCHGDGVYKGKPMACVSCHQSEYNATTNPAHTSAGFPTTCTTCHTTTTWLGAIFDHSATAFPLTGTHRTTTCISCHRNGVYTGTPTDCYTCHQTEYTVTTNPNHAAAMFPTTCVSCHTTTTWIGATFNHDQSWFPIYSGSHKGRWTTCSQCHTSPTNFASFTCLTCHGKSQTDSKHGSVSGYRYDSNACYACHPRGSS